MLMLVENTHSPGMWAPAVLFWPLASPWAFTCLTAHSSLPRQAQDCHQWAKHILDTTQSSAHSGSPWGSERPLVIAGLVSPHLLSLFPLAAVGVHALFFASHYALFPSSQTLLASLGCGWILWKTCPTWNMWIFGSLLLWSPCKGSVKTNHSSGRYSGVQWRGQTNYLTGR